MQRHSNSADARQKSEDDWAWQPWNLGQALLQTLHKEVFGQFTADEHHLIGGFLARLPRAALVSTHHLMDALENRLAVAALHVKHAFVAQHILAINLDQAR